MVGIKDLLLGKKKFVIMEANPSDYKQMAQLHGVSFSRGWSALEFATLGEQPECTILVARPVGEPEAAIGGFNLIRQTQEEAEILTVAVNPKQRRQGLGDALMREAILRLQADRVGTLFLEVDQENASAVKLYEKLGFTVVGNRPGYYSAKKDQKNPSPANAFIMRLDLI